MLATAANLNAGERKRCFASCFVCNAMHADEKKQPDQTSNPIFNIFQGSIETAVTLTIKRAMQLSPPMTAPNTTTDTQQTPSVEPPPPGLENAPRPTTDVPW